jgi:phosphoribosyl 1,2-cyclic phosphodiesterase
VRFTSLGSGSEGNALLLEASAPGHSTCRVLVDCGLGIRDLTERLALRGLEPAAIDLILVTHEHGDHSAGVPRVAKAAQCPVICTHGTRLAMGDAFDGILGLALVHAGATFEWMGLRIDLIAVPHDAREPVAIRFAAGWQSIAVVTDLGHVSPHVVNSLRDLDAVFLEFNHDAEMLRIGPYAPKLKARVGGDYGHLSNTQASDLLQRIQSNRMQRVVAAHLSQVNNHEDRVRESIAMVEWGSTCFEVASQQAGVDWVAVA